MHQRKGKNLFINLKKRIKWLHSVFLFAKVGNEVVIDHAKNKVTELANLTYFSPTVEIK